MPEDKTVEKLGELRQGAVYALRITRPLSPIRRRELRESLNNCARLAGCKFVLLPECVEAVNGAATASDLAGASRSDQCFQAK